MPLVESTKKKVSIKVVFLKVGEIDTVKENFFADIFVQARWREPSLDHSTHLKNIDLNHFWNPKMLVQNIISVTKKKTWKEISFTDTGIAYIVEKRRVIGHFSEKLELKDFPFDHQHLNIILTSELPVKELDIEEDQEDLSSINVSCFVDVQEWSLYDYVESVPYVNIKEFSPKRNIKFPGLSVGCCAVRRAGFFVWNVIAIMTLISSTSFATFSVSRLLPQNRLQLAITLMLTAVTFRLSTNANLPKISYHTRLDRFILCSMFFNWMVIVWHALITRFEYDQNLQSSMDNWAFIGFLIAYSLFLVVFGILVLITYVTRNNELQVKVQAYEARAEKLLGKSWKVTRAKQHNRDGNHEKARISRNYASPMTNAVFPVDPED